MDCSLQGSSVYRNLQARIQEWVAISSSRGIFPTQGLNLRLLHCRQILYPLSHQFCASRRWGWGLSICFLLKLWCAYVDIPRPLSSTSSCKYKRVSWGRRPSISGLIAAGCCWFINSYFNTTTTTDTSTHTSLQAEQIPGGHIGYAFHQHTSPQLLEVPLGLRKPHHTQTPHSFDSKVMVILWRNYFQRRLKRIYAACCVPTFLTHP